jgi:Family of unknown function (DUF5693)
VKSRQYTEGREVRQARSSALPPGGALREMGWIRTPRGLLLVVLGIALLAAAYVAAYRARVEWQTRRVEIAMDYSDFSALARSYGYNELQFLIALRRAGLTSLAVPEELGSGINSGNGAVLLPGQTLIDQARLGPLSDPLLAKMAHDGKLSPAELYLVVYNAEDLERYRLTIPLHLGPHAVRTLRATLPAILAVRSQVDFFSSLGFGIPAGQLDLARQADLLLVPRFQNDERFGAQQIDALFQTVRYHERVSTVVFFGLRNQVLGYPDHLDDTAAIMERDRINYGAIETYDPTQIQRGNEGLAQRLPLWTVRVQAISKTEQDKLDFRTVVARYLLGARERNIRVVYLRPYLHAEGDLSPEAANVEMVRQIAEGLRGSGFKLGRATPFRAVRANGLVIAIVSLAVPALILLLLETFGVSSRRWWLVAFGLDLVMIGAGVALHDLAARKVIALIGALAFSVAALVAVRDRFILPPRAAIWPTLQRGLTTIGIALGVALCGALVVVGLLSVPLTMLEIQHFLGIKALLVVPPLIGLALYLYTGAFGREPMGWRSALEPVRVYQMLAGLVLLAGLYLYVSRSGNQSDISPSTFELSLRSGLTSILGVRPRFKEFLIGIPLLMLLPALTVAHRRAVGWLFALGISMAAADVIDTFSHLHSPLLVSLIRVINGALIGAIIGAVLVLVYRRAVRFSRARSAAQ